MSCFKVLFVFALIYATQGQPSCSYPVTKTSYTNDPSKLDDSSSSDGSSSSSSSTATSAINGISSTVTAKSSPDSPPIVSYSYDVQLHSIVEDMMKCMDAKLEPILSKMTEVDQAEMKQLGVEGLIAYIEHLFWLVHQEEKNDDDTL